MKFLQKKIILALGLVFFGPNCIWGMEQKNIKNFIIEKTTLRFIVLNSVLRNNKKIEIWKI